MSDASRSVPFVSGRYTLKSVQREALTPVQELALNTAFPAFQRLEEPTARQSEEMAEARQKGIPVFWQQKPARRYGGDETLPPSRYKTLVRAENGDDGGALSMELLAYHDPEKAGAIGLADCCRPEIAQFFKGASSPVHQLIVSFLSWPDQRSPIWDVARRIGLLSEIERRNHRGISRPDETDVAVEVPYQLENVEFDRVIDLRLLQCQAWFLHTFGGSDLERHFKNDPDWTAFRSFPEMLPSLLWAEPGGAMFQGISQYVNWMRTHQVEGFVFPSARNDPSVLVENGVIKDYQGWNLVDYRGAPAPAINLMINVTFFNSPTALPEGIEIMVPSLEHKELQGTFAVKGLAAWHLQRLNRPNATGILDRI